MEQTDKNVMVCFHCGNETLMHRVASHTLKNSEKIGLDDYGDPLYVIEFLTTWNLFLCPVCKDVTLQREDWCSEDDPFTGAQQVIIYPSIRRRSGNIPSQIYAAYEAAIKVRKIDGAICALSLRRTLEMMCKDLGAEGRDLYHKLKYLSDNGVLPPILGDMATVLKTLGNAAAHGDDAEFDDEVVSAIIEFTQIILDYVYNIPASLKDIQQKIADKGFRRHGKKHESEEDKINEPA